MTTLYDGALFADYHQFYLVDAARTDDVPVGWTAEHLANRALAGAHAVLFSTARNMTVPVQVTLHEQAPAPDLADADHAVLTHFASDGEILIAGLTDYLPEATRLIVPKGPLAALAVSTGLATLSEDGLDGDDAYTIHLWPAPAGQGTRVLKQWVED